MSRVGLHCVCTGGWHYSQQGEGMRWKMEECLAFKPKLPACHLFLSPVFGVVGLFTVSARFPRCCCL